MVAASRTPSSATSAVSRDRYLAYTQRGLDVYGEADVDEHFTDLVRRHALLGTSDQVIAQGAAPFPRVPHRGPLLLRPQWPSMSADDAIALVRDLGREVIPALREIEPERDLPDPPAE